MILSNTEMQQALQDGRFQIDPIPMPLRRLEGVPCPYKTSSVDLRLGSEITFIARDRGVPINVDLTRGSFGTFFKAYAESRTIHDDQPFVIQPGQFVLGKTLERVTFPIFDDGRTCLAGRIEGKSSYARCGLLIHFTAPTIHSGFSGTITLELSNLGPAPISLYPNAFICQLIVEEVRGIPFRNDSQFQHQSRPGGSS